MIRFAPVLIFAALAVMLVATLAKQKPSNDVWEGRALPTLTLKPLGSDEAESLVLGKGYTLINIFASWCTPCLAEHPYITELSKQLPVIGIAWSDTPEATEAYLEKHGNPYARVYLDNAGDAAMPLGIRGVPESYLIDPLGRVRYHISGPVDATRVKEIMDKAGAR